MRDRLLRIIYELGERHTLGEAELSECQKRLGVDDTTFERLYNQLHQRGYFSDRCSYGSVKLSASGIHAAERLR